MDLPSIVRSWSRYLIIERFEDMSIILGYTNVSGNTLSLLLQEYLNITLKPDITLILHDLQPSSPEDESKENQE